jgi:hypothetical protein
VVDQEFASIEIRPVVRVDQFPCHPGFLDSGDRDVRVKPTRLPMIAIEEAGYLSELAGFTGRFLDADPKNGALTPAKRTRAPVTVSLNGETDAAAKATWSFILSNCRWSVSPKNFMVI